MANGIKKVHDQVSDRLDDLLKKAKASEAFLQRDAYPVYVEAQKKRFITENASETGKWGALNLTYAEWKRKNFSDYVGGGTKIGIRSGRLVSSILGEMFGSGKSEDGTKEHYKYIKGSTMIVGTATPYAKHFDDTRPLMKFRPEFINEIKERYYSYIKRFK